VARHVGKLGTSFILLAEQFYSVIGRGSDFGVIGQGEFWWLRWKLLSGRESGRRFEMVDGEGFLGEVGRKVAVMTLGFGLLGI